MHGTNLHRQPSSGLSVSQHFCWHCGESHHLQEGHQAGGCAKGEAVCQGPPLSLGNQSTGTCMPAPWCRHQLGGRGPSALPSSPLGEEPSHQGGAQMHDTDH